MPDDLRIGFVGAGNVNFGGGEGPWDHASRLERIGGVTVVGVADPDTERADRRLAARRAGPAAGLYADAGVYPDCRRMLAEARPDAVFVGVPPDAHASTDPPRDIEIACADAGVHMFLEKPLGCAPPEALAPVAEAMDRGARAGLIVSVGYMFRYSRAVERMREILSDCPGGPRVVLARYDCAYSRIASYVWWDLRGTGGPIIEQATHFCDLARYLAGDADPGSVLGVNIGGAEPAGRLLDVPVDPAGKTYEQDVPAEFRIPRATAAVWRFESGALGSLTHGALLHEEKYEVELEVWGDGLRMVLEDPYGRCRLRVRRPHTEQTETLDFAEDDPYLAEDAAFLDAVRSGDASGIRSPYADALKTYELTWAIRRASERARA